MRHGLHIRITLLATVLLAARVVSAQSIEFTENVLPILASRCFQCHGPDAEDRKVNLRLDTKEGLFGKTREGFPIVQGGNLDMSELWWRLTAEDRKDRMPPEEFPKSVTPEELATIKQWIENGATWEGHWAFEPLAHPSPPAVKRTEWVRNPIDSFVLAKLEAKGLAPSAEADRRTLARRLYFDLHGLPPTPEEMAEFVNDAAPDAYERLVDRLLASPRYGERWARHWLDVAHYADTHGYDKDKRRDHAWPYRDYVIESLNADKPYTRFVEEQLAGDVLYPDDPDALVATGFIAAGPWDFVGHVELREGTVDKEITRVLDRDDMVSSAMTTFTSLTVHCARCHDHKFDPISQKDYYALQAVFSGVERADRPYDADPGVYQTRQRLMQEQKEIQEHLSAWQTRLDSLSSPKIDELNTEIAALQEQIKALRAAESPSNGYHSLIAAEPDTTKWVQVDLGEPMPLDAIRLVPALPTDFRLAPGFGFPVRFKLEASADPAFSSSIVLLDQTETDHPARTDEPFRLELKAIEARYIRLTATRLWKRDNDYVFALAEMEVYSGGQNVAMSKPVTAMDSIDEGRWHTRYLTDGYDSRNRIASGNESVSTLNKAELRLKARKQERERERRIILPAQEQDELTKLELHAGRLASALEQLPKPTNVYAAASEFPPNGNFTPPKGMREIHVLQRGDVKHPLEVAASGTVGCLNQLPSRFDLPEGHAEGARRAALAHWITDESNPLTWRSIVNRVWFYHFGKGIVDTPNDFGRMGTPPTNRALLDWLATEFLARGQSLKEMHRLIVTSATYRQQSTFNAEFAALDASNQYLWRMNRRQLDAEALHDTMLYISGKLDFSMGGPGFDAFAFEDDHSPRYLYDQFDPKNPAGFRRSIYRFIVRSVPDPFMASLDCADPSQSVPVRNETITAIQALALLNNPMVVQSAEYLAERVESIAGDRAAQLDAIFQLALNRSPTPEESQELLQYAEAHGMAAVCRLVLNTNEFMFVD